MPTGFEPYVTNEDRAELAALGFDLADERLVPKWCEFSAIQAANWIKPTLASKERFYKWLETRDDQEAWS